MARLAQSLDSIRPHYDVVVVGSGYGAGVAASRLARAGRRVAVLERGREIATGEFPSRLPELRRELQMTGSKTRFGSPSALFDFRMGEDMHVLVGCGLGGGSLINAGVALRPDGRVFADPVWPGQIAQDGLLEEGFARARRWLRPASDPNAGAMPKYQALANASAAVGAPPEPAEVAVSFDDVTNPAGVAQPACTRCGDCCSGCNVGAKNTIALTYLPDAKAHGAEIFTEVRVDHLARRSDGWQIAFARNEWNSKKAADGLGTITADIVVLGGGTLGSTEILLRSRQAGLALSDRLGRGFSANGDIIAFGYGADVRVNAIGVGHPARAGVDTVGASVSGQIRIQNAERLDHEMYVQEGVLPSPLAPLLPVFFVPGGRLLGAAEALFKGVYKGPLAHLHTFFVVSHDNAAGRLELKDDRLAVTWPGAADEPVHGRVDAALESLVKANGGDYVKSPLAATSFGSKPATAHPLGGCGIGADRTRGVVSHKGQVFDGSERAQNWATHEGLYVTDGATMPRSLGCNPLLTITALAERAMMHLATDRGWEFDVESRA